MRCVRRWTLVIMWALNLPLNCLSIVMSSPPSLLYVQNFVFLKPIKTRVIYSYKPNFSDQLAITVHNSSRVREFILPIWSQAFLNQQQTKSQVQQQWNNWKCALWNPVKFMRDASLPFYFQKMPVFKGFHTPLFSLLLSESNTV